MGQPSSSFCKTLVFTRHFHLLAHIVHGIRQREQRNTVDAYQADANSLGGPIKPLNNLTEALPPLYGVILIVRVLCSGD